MMREATLKYLFWSLSVILLAFMLLTARKAGITCDEVLHYNQSVDVYNYFATGGKDTSALNNPVWHLMYYGQSFDNLTTILIKWSGIEDIYAFRHFMSSLAGWLTIIITALFAIRISGYRTGIFVLILFAITPAFIGHSHNNLKDIPFALGYISTAFLIAKFLSAGKFISYKLVILLILSIALTMSIRAAGAVLIFYLVFFLIIYFLTKYLKDKIIDKDEIIYKTILAALISFTAYFLSILLWPYALQDPLRNVVEAYRVMAHYPDTFRQIFEGRMEWSDFMPWYYLPKSMLITIPVVVLTGIVMFMLFLSEFFKSSHRTSYSIIIFTILFPVLFAILEKSNLYSSWRQFLFIYPAVVIIAASGFNILLEKISVRFLRWIVVAIVVLLSIHPALYMIRNPRYFYIYYNQLAGGLKGAWGNYETDYYYESQTEASEWLISYLKAKGKAGGVKVAATYSVSWQFRKYPETETFYMRNEERSMSDWDYAIVVNRYISPYKLKNGFWPPDNAIHIIYADSVPICAILERKSKDDYHGFIAMSEGKFEDAAAYFKEALKADDGDEMIFYNFAASLYKTGEKEKADSVLMKALGINPDFEPALMFLGNIAKEENRFSDAAGYYERVIKADRKYFEAYVSLSGLLKETDVMKSRELLWRCLEMNPKFRPAIIALADTYRERNPEIAEKYDKLAASVK